MANNFVALSVVGGSLNTWGTTLNTLIQAGGIGALTSELYNDSGTLKLSKGKIGINNGVATGIGVCIIDTITTISTAGMTAGLWHAIEVSVSGTAVTISITPIAGASDESIIDAATKAAYDYEKTGYYLTASKRLIGVVFLRAALSLGRIVNCESVKLGFKGIERKITRNSLGAESYIYIDKMTIQMGTWNMNTADRITHNLGFVITGRTYTKGTISAIIAGDTLQYSINSYGGFSVYKTDSLGVPTFVLFRETGGIFDGAGYTNAIASGTIEWET